VPLLREIAIQKQRAARSWDEVNRKVIEIQAYMSESNRVDYSPSRRPSAGRLNDKK
jgi:hypothetical protein